MTGLPAKQIVDVRDYAAETVFETVRQRLADGRLLLMNVHSRLGFTLAEFQRRYETVIGRMRAQNIDATLIRAPENITYLCGFETPGYYKYQCLVVSPEFEPVLVLRRFEMLNVPEYAWCTHVVPVDDWEVPPHVTGNLVRELGLERGRIGIEPRSWFYTIEEHQQVQEALPHAELVDAMNVVWEARVFKSDEEMNVMRRAAEICDRAMEAGFEIARPGIPDNVINAEVHRAIFENGGEYMSLPPFVLSGERTSLPHQTARSDVVGERDLVFFELSATKWRYCCALMRTLFVGTPTDRQRRVAEACIAAVNAAMDAIRPGAVAEDVDRIARAEVEKAGFGEYFRHRLGYSVGVNYPPDWGEGEIISLCHGEKRTLETGMVFHMVPLCLLYREFGIGFSETVRVTSDGCERFSQLPREVVVKD